MDDMIKLVLKCLKCENNRIIFVSLNFLDIVQLFEPKWSEKIKRKKFNIFNKVKFMTLTVIELIQDFIKYLKNFQKELNNYEAMNKFQDQMIANEEEENEYEEDFEDENHYYYKK